MAQEDTRNDVLFDLFYKSFDTAMESIISMDDTDKSRDHAIETIAKKLEWLRDNYQY